MFPEILVRLAAELDRRGIPYMVVGGQAVMAFGEPRLTRDIDVTLGVGADELPALLEAAAACSLRPLVDPEPFVRDTMVLPCADAASGLRVDLIFSHSSYEKAALGRARVIVVHGAGVRFASPEDLVILKVIAGRARDLEDARSVLRKNPGLDRELVRRELALLQAALDEPFLERWRGLETTA